MSDRGLVRTTRDQYKTNLWAINNSTKDVPFFVSLKDQTVSISLRRGTSEESFIGTLSAVIYQGGDQNACMAGIVIEEPPQRDGATQVHYVPIDALSLVSFRVVKPPA